jgi:hypothetical protein
MTRLLGPSIALGALLGGLLPAPALAQKDVASCKPVFDAMAKQLETPTHVYGSEARTGRPPRQIETINIGNVAYLNLGGKWKTSPETPKQTSERETQNIRDAKVVACKRLGDTSVSGVAATTYGLHYDTGFSSADGQIWIARGTGLPLKSENTIKVDEGETMRVSTRYEYTGVRRPL